MNKTTKSIITAALLVLAAVVLIAGCNAELQSDNSSTATVCANPVTPQFPILDGTRSLIFVLVEANSTYYEAGNIHRTQTTLKYVLPKLMKPGDRLILAWIENNELEGLNKTVFFDATADLVAIPMTPTMPTAPTSIPRPTETPFARLRETALAETVQAADVTSTASYYDYVCQFADWSKRAQSTADASRAQIKTSVDNLVGSADTKLQSNDLAQFLDDASPHIFETISRASKFLGDMCAPGKYDHCVLLFFSNMKDWRRDQDPKYLRYSTDLNRIGVAVVLYSCRYDDDECGKRIAAWQKHFDAYHTTLHFVLDGNIEGDLQNYLNDLLRR